MLDKGYVWFAFGDKYIEASERLATSIKKHNKNNKINWNKVTTKTFLKFKTVNFLNIKKQLNFTKRFIYNKQNFNLFQY